MTRNLSMILVAISIVIVVIGLVYIYRNKIEHFYQNADNANTIIESKFNNRTINHPKELSCISGYIDTFGTPHLFATSLIDEKYKLLKDHFGRFELLNDIKNFDDPEGKNQNGSQKLTDLNNEGVFYQIDVRTEKENRISMMSTSKPVNIGGGKFNGTIKFKWPQDKYFLKTKNNSRLCRISGGYSYNNKYSVFVGLGHNAYTFIHNPTTSPPNIDFQGMKGHGARLITADITNSGRVLCILKQGNGRIWEYNSIGENSSGEVTPDVHRVGAQLQFNKGWGPTRHNNALVINRNIIDINIKFTKNTHEDENQRFLWSGAESSAYLCITALVAEGDIESDNFEPTFKICYVYLKLVGVYTAFREHIGEFFYNPQKYVNDKINDTAFNMENGKPSVGMINIPAPLDSVRTKHIINDTIGNLEGKYWWDASESLYDIDLDLDNNLHIWVLQKDKKVIQYYNNIEPFTLPETEANKDKILKGLKIRNSKGGFVTPQAESSGNKPTEEDEFTLLINDDTSVSIIGKNGLLSARSDGKDFMDNRERFPAKVVFYHKSKITDEERFDIVDNTSGNVSLKNKSTGLNLGIDSDGVLVQTTDMNTINFKIFQYSPEKKKDENVGPQIVDDIYSARYGEYGWVNNDKLDRLDSVNVNVSQSGTQYLWGTLRSNIYNRKLGNKIIAESRVSNWIQTPGFGSYVNVNTDDYKKQYLWCIGPNNVINYAVVNPNSENLSNSLLWTPTTEKGKKIITNGTCDGMQLIWIIGDDDKVKHGIYDRNFRDLAKGFKVLKDDNGDDITASDLAANLDNNGVQTLYVVNDEAVMQIELDSNHNKLKETIKSNTSNKKLVKISTAINQGGLMKTYGIDNDNKLYQIGNIEKIDPYGEPFDGVRFKYISNGVDASGSEYLWAITPGNLIFYKTSFTLKQSVDYDTLLTPDVKNYINNQLNKYSDGQSLPTLTELKALETLKDNQTAEQIAEIPKLLKDFKSQTKNYVEFHKDYETNLEQLLNKYLDVKKGVNSKETEMNEQRIMDIKKEVEKLKYQIEDSSEAITASSKTGSFRNLSNGKMINFKNDRSKTGETEDGKPIYSYGKNITLTVNGSKKNFDLTTNSHQSDPNNRGLGCVGYTVENGISIGDCGENEKNNLSFKVSEVRNVEEYNDLINKMPKEWKTRVSEYDKVTYPFTVLEHANNPGYCLDYDKDELRILPCYNTQTQRYKTHNYQIKQNCDNN